MQDRIKQLNGVTNFRDFGGYETTSGHRVKAGKLYRSAAFNQAEETDLKLLNSFGIDFQVDLRRQSERVADPNLWAPHEVHSFNDLDAYKPSHLEFLDKGKLSGEDAFNFIIEYYAIAPWVDAHIDLYKRWFQRLAVVDGAGLIHCAAGKDRTGIGCALTLALLDVDHTTIMQDYLLTNETIDFEARIPKVRAKWEKRLDVVIEEDEAIYPFLGVREEYLVRAVEEITRKHGSLRAYAYDVLGVDDALVQSLKTKLLD